MKYRIVVEFEFEWTGSNKYLATKYGIFKLRQLIEGGVLAQDRFPHFFKNGIKKIDLLESNPHWCQPLIRINYHDVQCDR